MQSSFSPFNRPQHLLLMEFSLCFLWFICILCINVKKKVQYKANLELQLSHDNITGLIVSLSWGDVWIWVLVCVQVWSRSCLIFADTQMQTFYTHTKLAFSICQYSISVSHPNTLSPTLTPTRRQTKCQEIIRRCLPTYPSQSALHSKTLHTKRKKNLALTAYFTTHIQNQKLNNNIKVCMMDLQIFSLKLVKWKNLHYK